MNDDSIILQNLKNNLIMQDISVKTVDKIIFNIKNTLRNFTNKDLLEKTLFDKMLEILQKVEKVIELDFYHIKPQVILICGVNGIGKTTIVAKIANILQSRNHRKVFVGGCDTFRAAASEQLEKLLYEAKIPLLTKSYDKEKAATVALKAYNMSKKEKSDILIIDTAGRMHNKTDLMNELHKITKILNKCESTAPHHTLLAIDANNGQNAKFQIEFFKKFVNITGIILTKLDCCTKGGIVVSIADEFPMIPIHALSIGQGINDFVFFDAKNFLETMMEDVKL